MKKNNLISVEKLTEKDLEKIVKNSPSLQKHFAESRKIFKSIPKEELEKIFQR